MSEVPNSCPKCGSSAMPIDPFAYNAPAQRRRHFSCDSYGYTENDEFRIARRSDLCCEREGANKYRRAVELIAEDCESWLKSESDEPSVDFIKLVAKYAREVLQ